MTEPVPICDHDAALLKACMSALEHIRELEQAWMTGAINECDGKGGTRSNRNAEVRVELAAAIAKAESKESENTESRKTCKC